MLLARKSSVRRRVSIAPLRAVILPRGYNVRKRRHYSQLTQDPYHGYTVLPTLLSSALSKRLFSDAKPFERDPIDGFGPTVQPKPDVSQTPSTLPKSESPSANSSHETVTPIKRAIPTRVLNMSLNDEKGKHLQAVWDLHDKIDSAVAAGDFDRVIQCAKEAVEKKIINSLEELDEIGVLLGAFIHKHAFAEAFSLYKKVVATRDPKTISSTAHSYGLVAIARNVMLPLEDRKRIVTELLNNKKVEWTTEGLTEALKLFLVAPNQRDVTLLVSTYKQLLQISTQPDTNVALNVFRTLLKSNMLTLAGEVLISTFNALQPHVPYILEEQVIDALYTVPIPDWRRTFGTGTPPLNAIVQCLRKWKLISSPMPIQTVTALVTSHTRNKDTTEGARELLEHLSVLGETPTILRIVIPYLARNRLHAQAIRWYTALRDMNVFYPLPMQIYTSLLWSCVQQGDLNAIQAIGTDMMEKGLNSHEANCAMISAILGSRSYFDSFTSRKTMTTVAKLRTIRSLLNAQATKNPTPAQKIRFHRAFAAMKIIHDHLYKQKEQLDMYLDLVGTLSEFAAAHGDHTFRVPITKHLTELSDS